MQPVKQAFAINGAPRISADIYGSGTIPLLLLHGFPATGSLWREVAPALDHRFRVIVPDLPGVGGSLPAEGAVSIAGLADSMLGLLDAAGAGTAIVAGHSMGGYIALAMAAKAPDRISGLSLVHSTAMPDDEEKKASRRKAIALIEKGGRETFIRSSVGSLFSDNFKERHAAAVEAQISESLEISGGTLISFYNAMMERPGRIDILQEAGFPVQWIIGDEDTVIPREKGLQQSSIARRSFVSLYKDCGHMSMLEAPQLLAKDINAFAVYCSKEK